MYYLFFCLPSSNLFCLYFFHTLLFFAFFHQSYSDIDFISHILILISSVIFWCWFLLFFYFFHRQTMSCIDYASFFVTYLCFLKKTLAQVFSREFCEISKNTFFYRTPSVATSGQIMAIITFLGLKSKNYFKRVPVMTNNTLRQTIIFNSIFAFGGVNSIKL